MKERFDTFFTGLNLGAIVPLGGFYLIYIWINSKMGGQQTFDEFMDNSTGLDRLPKLMALSVFISCLPLFFACLWMDMGKAAMGVLGATLFYGLVIIILIGIHWITT